MNKKKTQMLADVDFLYPQLNLGGDIGKLAGTALSFIPGIGPIAGAVASPVLGAIGNVIGDALAPEPPKTDKAKEVTPQWNTMEAGGYINNYIAGIMRGLELVYGGVITDAYQPKNFKGTKWGGQPSPWAREAAKLEGGGTVGDEANLSFSQLKDRKMNELSTRAEALQSYYESLSQTNRISAEEGRKRLLEAASNRTLRGQDTVRRETTTTHGNNIGDIVTDNTCIECVSQTIEEAGLPFSKSTARQSNMTWPDIAKDYGWFPLPEGHVPMAGDIAQWLKGSEETGYTPYHAAIEGGDGTQYYDPGRSGPMKKAIKPAVMQRYYRFQGYGEDNSIYRQQAKQQLDQTLDAMDIISRVPEITPIDPGQYSNLPEAKDGIYIKPSKSGTFTEAAKKRGMGVQEFASKVMANKDEYSSSMVKKANFARNASKWKKPYGGRMDINPKQIWANIFDQMKFGGTISPNDMKQYKAPSHAKGGQLVDKNGNPVMKIGQKPAAEIELAENGTRLPNGEFWVFSDRLKYNED